MVCFLLFWNLQGKWVNPYILNWSELAQMLTVHCIVTVVKNKKFRPSSSPYLTLICKHIVKEKWERSKKLIKSIHTHTHTLPSTFGRNIHLPFQMEAMRHPLTSNKRRLKWESIDYLKRPWRESLKHIPYLYTEYL